MKALAVLAVVAAMSLPAMALGQDTGPISTATGVFSAEQAMRGEALFRRSCAKCHGNDLIATDKEASNLTGGAFVANWIGQNLRDRYEIIRYGMPVNEPDSLPPDEYLDIMAYILSFNKVPAGAMELVLDEDLLARIVVEKP